MSNAPTTTPTAQQLREAEEVGAEVDALIAAGRLCDCCGVGCRDCDPHDGRDPYCRCSACGWYASGGAR